MGRTGGYWEQDSAFPDGQIFIFANASNVIGATATTDRASLGDWFVSIPAGATVTIPFFTNSLLTRYGKQDDAQQEFGLANPVAGFQGAQSQPVPPTVFTTPWGPTGRPPQPSSSFGQPITQRPKGITIKAITPVYGNNNTALTSATVGVTKTVYTNGAAQTITQLLVPAALPTAATSTLYATPVPLPVQSQVMLTDRFSEIIIELDITTAAVAAAVYGCFLDVAYNYN
jgi:hypothetical protein